MIQSRRSHIVHVNGRAVALWLRTVVVITMIGCVWMTGARAGVLEVDDGDTAGLISAINTALADPMIDTINLAPNGEYVLTAPADFFSGANGLPQIYSALVINGNGATIRRSDAMGTPEFRFFYLTIFGDLTLNNLTLANGSQFIGGAIRNGGGTLTIVDCAFIDNVSTSSGPGGAIYSFNNGAITLIGSSFTGNSAGTGGAIYNFNALATVVDCTFGQNSAATAGGALHNTGENGVMHVSSSIVTGNSAASRGAGLYNSDGELFVTDCTITGNMSGSGGGGIANNDDAPPNVGVVTVFNSEIIGNTSAAGSGGGVRSNGGALIIENSLIAENTATGHNGGGIWNTGSLTLTDSEIRENQAIGSQAMPGDPITGGGAGGVSTESGPAVITNCRFIDNTADSSGGGVVSSIGDGGAGQLTLVDSTFETNSAGASGGGLFSNAPLDMSGCTFVGNIAASGGGYSNGVSGSATVVNCTFSGNTADIGGGVGNSSQIGVSLHNCTITGNTGSPGAGLFNSVESALTVSNTIVAGNIGSTDTAGSFDDAGFNLFGDGSGVSHPDSFDGDPMLESLTDNGGPTLTHALAKMSIAVDAGDCAGDSIDVDQRGVARPQGKGCDIGAFEREAEGIPADLTGDGVVNGADLAALLAQWGTDGAADLNHDGVVDGADLAALLANWG